MNRPFNNISIKNPFLTDWLQVKKLREYVEKLCSINCLCTSLSLANHIQKVSFPGLVMHVDTASGSPDLTPLFQVEWADSIPNLSFYYLLHHLSVQVTWGGVSINHGCTRSFLESQRCWHILGLAQHSDRWMAWMAASLKIKMSCLQACVFGCPGTVPLWISHIFLCFTQQPLWLEI